MNSNAVIGFFLLRANGTMKNGTAQNEYPAENALGEEKKYV